MNVIEEYEAKETPPLGANPLAPHEAVDERFTAPLIQEIIEVWRARQDMVHAEQKITLQIKSICRRFCAGDITEADKLYRSMQNGMGHELAERCYVSCAGLFESRTPLKHYRKLHEKALVKLAQQLPAIEFCNSVKGFGPMGLAAIAAEIGDMSKYHKGLDGVMKRAGLAVIDGERQRKKVGDAALLHIYSPERRAIFWTIGDSLLKSQGKDQTAGPYRKIYDARKELERARVDSDGHAHNRALRYMTKKLVRDLHRMWSL